MTPSAVVAPQAAGSDLLVDSVASNSTPTGQADQKGSPYTLSSDQTYDHAYVGLNGTGTLTQSGGTLSLSGALYLGFNQGSLGVCNLGNSGTVATTGVMNGNGQGVLHFDGGNLRAAADSTTFVAGPLLTVDVRNGGVGIDTNGHNVTITQGLQHSTISGDNALDGGLVKNGAGTLTLSGTNTYTGSTTINAGTLAITGGSVGVAALTPRLTISGAGTGTAAASLGLSGGSLMTYNAVIGASGGLGVVNQSGGSFVTTGSVGVLIIGNLSGSGTYNLSGTSSILNTYTTYIGYKGTGTFNQSGGSFTTNGGSLYLGYSTGGVGTFTLSGGTLTTDYTQVSDTATASSFTQTGGTHTTNILSLSGNSTSSQGTYTLAGGTLNTGFVANHDSITSTVGTSLFHFNGGTLQASADSTTFMQGLTTADVQSGGATGNTAGGAVLDTQGYNVTVAQNLVHDTRPNAPATDGGLTKQGVGTLTFTGTSNYTGPTQVSAGTLAVNGALLGTGMLSVGSSATLAGTGSIAGPVQAQAGGTFAPGQAGAGKLTLGNTLTLSGTATAVFTLAGTGSTQALVAGQINLGTAATLSLTLASGFTPVVGTKFYLLDQTGTQVAVLGTFANAPLTGSQFTLGGVTYQINYADRDPADTSNALPNDISVTVIAVPEPSTWVLLTAGTVLLGVSAHRRCRPRA